MREVTEATWEALELLAGGEATTDREQILARALLSLRDEVARLREEAGVAPPPAVGRVTRP